MAKPSGDHIPLGGLDYFSSLVIGAPAVIAKNRIVRMLVERRAKRRTTINRNAQLLFLAPNEVRPCCVLNITNDGAGIQLSANVKGLPAKFGISFDRFRTMRKCSLIWHQGNRLGVALEG
jgi:hypothetical protein